jgi:hypothetical protein
MVFKAKLVGAGLSAMESYTLTEHECSRLDKAIAKHARWMLGKRTVAWEGEHPIRWSNHKVLLECGIIPTIIEMAVRRWQWVQSMSKHRQSHHHIITMIWGKAKCEEEPTVTAEGKLNEGFDVNEMAKRIDKDYNVFTVKTDSKETEAMKEQGKIYNDMVKDDPQHSNGPPHTYQFMALITALKNRGESTGAKNHTTLISIAAKFEAWGLEQRAEAVKVCRLARAYDQKIKKLFVVLGTEFTPEEQKCIWDALTQTGAVRKYGRPPPGAMERELSQWIKDLLESE